MRLLSAMSLAAVAAAAGCRRAAPLPLGVPAAAGRPGAAQPACPPDPYGWGVNALGAGREVPAPGSPDTAPTVVVVVDSAPPGAAGVLRVWPWLPGPPFAWPARLTQGLLTAAGDAPDGSIGPGQVGSSAQPPCVLRFQGRAWALRRADLRVEARQAVRVSVRDTAGRALAAPLLVEPGDTARLLSWRFPAGL